MFRSRSIAIAAAIALGGSLGLAAGAASAGNVAWSVSVGGPGYAVTAGGPGYRGGYAGYRGTRAYLPVAAPYYPPYAAPIVYSAPVVYPAPVIYPAPVAVARAYAPRVVVAAPVWRGGYRIY
jgi:hypothetical protein